MCGEAHPSLKRWKTLKRHRFFPVHFCMMEFIVEMSACSFSGVNFWSCKLCAHDFFSGMQTVEPLPDHQGKPFRGVAEPQTTSFESEPTLANIKIHLPILDVSFFFCSRSLLSETLKPLGTNKPRSNLISADYKHIEKQSDTPSILSSLGVPRGESSTFQ